MLLLMFVVGALIGSFVSGIFAAFMGSSEALVSATANLVAYPIMFIPPMIYASYQSRKNQFFGTGYELDNSNFFPFNGPSLALSVSVATIAAAFVLDIVNAILPPMPEYLEKAMKMLMDAPIWITLLSVSVLAPIFEEWLCRGMILRGLLQKMKPIWAIVISAVVFAAIHMNIWQAIPAFCFGLLFGYVYYRTGSLKLTMLMHCVNNTLSTILAHTERFGEIDSFLDVMSKSTYIMMFILCVLMLLYFIARMQRIEIPFGQKSGCAEVTMYDEEPAEGGNN